MALRIVIPNRPPSEEVIRTVAEKSGNKVLLAFSGGKDAIGAFLALLEADIRTGQNLSSLPDDLVQAMLTNLNQPLDLGADIEGDVAL